MSIASIKQNVLLVRCAIKKAIANNEFSYSKYHLDFPTMLRNFPKGCCDISSELVAQFLVDNMDLKLKIVNGRYKDVSHTWIETEDNCIIDITLDQFRCNSLFRAYSLPEVFVGEKNALYDCFRIARSELFINWYNIETDYSYTFRKVYETIVKYI